MPRRLSWNSGGGPFSTLRGDAMTIKQRTWRFASLLAVLLVAGTAAAAQAGVIWCSYNSQCGPACYPAYGCTPVYRGCSPCATSYYVPAYGCGSCAPVRYLACASGCGSVVTASFYEPCSNS